MNISNLTFPPEFNSTRETLYLNESKSTGYITDIGNGNLIALIGNGFLAAKNEPHDEPSSMARFGKNP